MVRTWLAALALAGATACGGAQTGPRDDDSDRLSPTRLYPLAVGTVWTYDVDTGDPLTTLAITRVVATEGDRVQVSSGSDPVTYERRDEGLYRPERGGWLLRAPIREGARWDAGGGATAEVREVDLVVETLAGTFRGCVAVEETGDDARRTVRTVYCPDVGPVEVDSSMQLTAGGAQSARVRAVLRGYSLHGM